MVKNKHYFHWNMPFRGDIKLEIEIKQRKYNKECIDCQQREFRWSSDNTDWR